MGLVAGSLSVSRFELVSRLAEYDFDALGFEPLPAATERRESIGFVPMEPDAPYRVGHDLWAFRIRFDRVRPDPTAVAERLHAYERGESRADGLEHVPARRRRELKTLAEEEIARLTPPRTAFVEGALDGRQLYLASTARSRLGACLTLLRGLGIEAHAKAPWIEAGLEPEPLAGVRFNDPGASAHGCRFLRALIEQGDAMAEPVSGAARVAFGEVEVALKGSIHVELFRLFEQGGEPLSAKLVTEHGAFRFEAPTYRIAGLKSESELTGGWIERLDTRLGGLRALFDWLDERYARLEGAAASVPSRPDETVPADAAGD